MPQKRKPATMREAIQPVFRLVSSLRTINDRLLTARIHITLSQFKILTAVQRAPKISQRAIAGFWLATEASVSRQVEILHKKKMLARILHPKSRREHLLCLTARGAATLQKADRLIDAQLEKIFRDITERERREFSALVNHLLSLVSDHS